MKQQSFLNYNVQHQHQHQQLLQCKSFGEFIERFQIMMCKQNQNQMSKSKILEQKIIRTLKETLIYQEKFYQNYNKSINLGFQIVEYLVSRDLEIDQHLKKCNLNIFILISICKGYLQSSFVEKDKIKPFFIKSCKKTNQFWGLHHLEIFYQNLIDKSMGYFPPYSPNDSKLQIQQLKYFINFYFSSKDFFSINLEYRTYMLRMLLTLRLQTKQQKEVYDILQKEYFLYEHHYQITTKNFRFMIEFFRNPFNQKQCMFYPQKVVLKLLAKYQTYQIQNIVHTSQIGLFWNLLQLNSCIGNIIKLGLSQVSFKLFKAFIQCGLNNRKYQQLISIFQTNILKIYIFLKYAKLFQISMMFLKYMSYSSSVSTVGLYTKIIEKALPFAKNFSNFQGNFQHELQFFQYLQVISVKYHETSSTGQLNKFLQETSIKRSQLFIKVRPTPQKIKEILNQYQWKINCKIQQKNITQNPNGKKQSNKVVYKGLMNIGNSCYMNSFLQCLYMTVQLRNTLLDVSTLQLSRNVIKKLNQGSNKATNDRKQIQTLAKQSVRPAAQMQRLFAQLLRSQRPSINPTSVKAVCPLQFKNCFQQDTIQFGRSILQVLSSSSLKNIFQGQQINEIICSICQKSRFKKQPFIDIMLTNQIYTNIIQSLKSEKHQKHQHKSNQEEPLQLTLENMFKHFLIDQTIQNLTCDHCNQKSQKSIRKHFIGLYPNYLILTLKRFEYDPVQKKNKKKHYQVQLCQQIINLNNQQMYEIYAIIVHRGQSANSGHYFSFCKEACIKQQQVGQIVKSQKEQNDKVKQSQIQNSQMINEQEQDKKNTQQNRQQKLSAQWLCFNDSQVTYFQNFKSVTQFFDLNSQDTPYIILLQKVSHIKTHPNYYSLKLREPSQKFIEKDNIDYLKNLQKAPLIDWKNFGKNFKGFDYSKLRKFQQDQEDQGGNGRGGGGFGFNVGNMPIL